MKYAVIDTESSGLFDFAKPADAEGQPRLASLGIVMLNEDLSVQAEHELLVKPAGWVMGAEAMRINGLTMERLNTEGLDLAFVLRKYITLIETGYVIATFNAQYDTKIMRGELRRSGLPDLFETTPNVCLMRALTGVCRLPKANGRGYKFPKLSEACAHFKIEQPAAHSALGDARSAAALLRCAKRIGVLPEPEVHYAVNRPDKPAPAKPAVEDPTPQPTPTKGDLKVQNDVELEFNGTQWLPLRNHHNYPKLFNLDGSPKAHA